MTHISRIVPVDLTEPEASNTPSTLALVPTMGALHEGHLSLIKQAQKHADRVVVSIFVNPTQFAPNEDFDSYPRTLEADLNACKKLGVDVVWTPTEHEIYPEGAQNAKKIIMPSELTQILCGVSRPHFFDGVTTVVYRLFELIKPDIAIFGEKDFQQLTILKKMVDDYSLNVKIIGAPIIRETDGLAMSSRNQYLSANDRLKAVQLSQSLNAVNRAFQKGEKDVVALKNIASHTCPDLKLDYCEIVDPKSLALKHVASSNDRVCIAAWCGNTRLIDNSPLSEST